jgi:hypothetical protein
LSADRWRGRDVGEEVRETDRDWSVGRAFGYRQVDAGRGFGHAVALQDRHATVLPGDRDAFGDGGSQASRMTMTNGPPPSGICLAGSHIRHHLISGIDADEVVAAAQGR